MTGAGLAVTTSVVFYKTEVHAKENGKASGLSKEINEINENDDTVYVTAPDGVQGEMA